MSALPPRAAQKQTCQYGRYVPIPDSCTAATARLDVLTQSPHQRDKRIDVGTLRPDASAILTRTDDENRWPKVIKASGAPKVAKG